jgi:hypothetical protein
MGPRLGIFYYNDKTYPSAKNDRNLQPGFYPSQPMLSLEEWQNIIDYYTSIAPDSLSASQRSTDIKSELPGFRVQVPGHKFTSPAITLTKIDTTTASHHLWAFDLTGKSMYRYNNQLQVTDSAKTGATITDVDFGTRPWVACDINVINPNNGKFGKAHYLYADTVGKLSLDSASLFDQLARPVQITSCDLNKDGTTDFLVCEFGHLTGSLLWMEGNGDGRFARHIIRPEPGAIKAYVDDVNHDGLQDIWALFTQGEEGIFLFTNKGNGVFDQQQILRFPSIYGSTYFEFADFNNDGLKDILYTCGDNADYSVGLKPYHGVYIFLNEGQNRFKQKYFYPINGCFKAMARDFDRDGDLDIASIAFFADYAQQPEEGFVYLENKGDFDFIPQTTPECRAGRWLTMDAGDLDGDGRIDLVLGNFSIRSSIQKSSVDWKKGPPLMVLKNISK